MTVTRGIVSALDRAIDTSSGGPLVNALGEVIGIDDAIAIAQGVTGASV